MRQILLFAALAASLTLLAGCTLSKTKEDKAEDMTDKAAYQKISAEEAYEMMASQEVVSSRWCSPCAHRPPVRLNFSSAVFAKSLICPRSSSVSAAPCSS